jgi:hypothetical protein
MLTLHQKFAGPQKKCRPCICRIAFPPYRGSEPKRLLEDVTVSELSALGTFFELRHLKVGDFTWVCRDRVTAQELVLPYIVERKRMDDLASSIRDGRFHEQKVKQICLQFHATDVTYSSLRKFLEFDSFLNE